MITVGGYFVRGDLDSVLARLASLPDRLRPTRYGDSERIPPSANDLASSDRFEHFRSRNEAGFFLFAPSCMFDVTISAASPHAEIFVYSLDEVVGLAEEDVDALAESMAGPGLRFFFAADRDEYEHRNRFTAELGDDLVEAWVGRDLTRYLPGLYWRTMLPADSARHLDFSNRVDAVLMAEPVGFVTLKMSGQAEDWRRWKERLDAETERSPAIFSLRAIRSTLEKATTLDDLIDALAAWR